MGQELTVHEKRAMVVLESNQSPLSRPERSRLNELEAELAAILGQFYRMGEIIEEVYQRKLYREEYHSFGEWAKTKFNFNRQHAMRCIQYALLKRNLTYSGFKEFPMDQGQAKALMEQPYERQGPLWERALSFKDQTDDGLMPRGTTPIKKACEELYPTIYFDRYGVQLSDDLAGVMDSGVFGDLMIPLHEFERRILALGNIMGAYLDTEEAHRYAKLLLELLKGALFHAACPRCKGKKCVYCKQTGYVPEHLYISLTNRENSDGKMAEET